MGDESRIELCYPCGHVAGSRLDGPPPDAAWPETAGVYWKRLKELPREQVADFSGGSLTAEGLVALTCLNETWVVDPQQETVQKVTSGGNTEWDVQLPFLILVYLSSVKQEPATYDMVVPNDLFQGVDLFRTALRPDKESVEKRFGQDKEAFFAIANSLGGEEVRGGDAARRFHVFPKFPIDYILWLEDEEFPASLTILVDRGVSTHLPVDAIGVLLNLLSRRLCQPAG